MPEIGGIVGTIAGAAFLAWCAGLAPRILSTLAALIGG